MPEQRNRADFTNTHWSIVRAAGGARSPRAEAALASLCEAYWYPLFAFLRSHGHSPDEAEDLTQAFFLHVLEKGMLRHANRDRGRFRSFMLTSLKNFVANEHDRRQAKKRGGGAPVLSLDVETAEGRFQVEPPTEETPEKVFDRRWALTLLDRVFARLGEKMTPRKAHQFALLKVHVMGEQTEGGYARTAAALAMSEVALRVEIHRLRRRLRELVREEIAHTVSSPEELEDEIRHLLSSLGR